MIEETTTKGPQSSYMAGLGLTFGGGAGLVLGGAFDAAGKGLIFGAGVGLVLATVVFAMVSHSRAEESTPPDDGPSRPS